jgi:ferrous iron transport protein A
MQLSKLSKGQKAVIKNVNCQEELKQRFYSFGIIRGTEVTVDEISLTKNTIAINVDGTEIAIRIDEARFIEVEVV